MKILQINAVYKTGSTGRIVSEIHEYLMQNGMKSYVACANVNDNKDIFQIGTRAEHKIHALLSRLTGKQGYYSRRGTKKLIQYIDAIEPDIVHLHNLHGNYISFPMLMAYLAHKDIATVVTLHDCWFYTGKCVHYYIDNCYRWKEKCGSCPRVKKDNVSFFFDTTESTLYEKKRMYDAIPRLGVIGVSDWIAREAKESILNCAKKIERIYNWIDLEIFKPDIGCESNDTKTMILAVAMEWKLEKGLMDVLEVSKCLKEDEYIVLLGKIPAGIALPSNVTHVEKTSDQYALAKYYQRATVFLNLSWMESFGKVSAEALACGTPIICYNTTASPELVGEGCGYVVEKGDIKGVYEKIRIIKRNKDIYSEKCIKFAHHNFNKNKNLSKLVSFYKQL